MIERFGIGGRPTRVIIDTGPDFRAQLITAGVDAIDAVVYTHAHADHLHGIDDLRSFWIAQRKPVTVYTDDDTQARIDAAFGYCFQTPPGSQYPPFLERRRIEPGQEFVVDGPGGPVTLMPFRQIHGDISSLGFRAASVAYSCDFNDIPDESLNALDDLDLWVVDALRRRPHPSHCTVEQAIDWVKRIQPQRALLTHMTNELDYGALISSLPRHIKPAFDGLVVDFDLAENRLSESAANQ